MLKNADNLFLLSKGYGVPVCKYAAIKFLEITTIHAEGYPSGEFRHGPLSMIDDVEKTPVIFILLDDDTFGQVESNIRQIRERGASIYIITDCPGKMDNKLR